MFDRFAASVPLGSDGCEAVIQIFFEAAIAAAATDTCAENTHKSETICVVSRNKSSE